METVNQRLELWLAAHSFGRKPPTLEFNAEIVHTLRRLWPEGLDRPAAHLGEADLLAVGQRLAHYSPARWNAFVSALRFVSAAGRILPRRRLRIRDFTPPTAAQWQSFLAACDANPRSHAGLVVRSSLTPACGSRRPGP
jgi:hypothetical protein